MVKEGDIIMDERRNRAFNQLQAKLLEHKELEAQVKQCND
jgi:hypothetical protein